MSGIALVFGSKHTFCYFCRAVFLTERLCESPFEFLAARRCGRARCRHCCEVLWTARATGGHASRDCANRKRGRSAGRPTGRERRKIECSVEENPSTLVWRERWRQRDRVGGAETALASRNSAAVTGHARLLGLPASAGETLRAAVQRQVPPQHRHQHTCPSPPQQRS